MQTAAFPLAPDVGRPSPWLISPAVDLLFVCGGVAWLFVLADQALLRPHVPEMLGAVTVTMSVVSLLLGSSHTAATWVRIYDSAESRTRFATYTRWLPLALLGLGLVQFGMRETLPIVLKVTLFWNLHHYTAQSYGFVLIYCLKRSYTLSALDKRTLKVCMTLQTVTIIALQLTYREYNLETFLGQQMPFWGPLPVWVSKAAIACLAASVLALGWLVVARGVRARRWLPLPATALVVTNLLLMVTPVHVWNILWAYMPALFHGSQYVIITLLYLAGARSLGGAGARSFAGGVPATPWQRLAASGAASRYILMVALGAFFYNAVPQTLEQAGIEFNLSFAIIYSLVSLHHYATDGAIWRLRDDRLRAVLVG